MKEIKITAKEEGQSLHKLLCRVMPQAGGGFLYKMLRKKNITLNEKKADGKELLQAGDLVKIYFTEETLQKFMGSEDRTQKLNHAKGQVDVIYEDSQVLILNKPAGMLSQKSKDTDVSMNEEMIQYLIHTGFLTTEDLKVFRPSICNRLDRNTSGLVICGKTIHGLQQMNELLKSRGLHKYYRCIVSGTLTEKKRIHGFLVKDERKNKVRISEQELPDSQPIETEYTPLQCFVRKDRNGKEYPCTYLEVLLITGRSHQIRAHLSSIGHPLLGDEKYGNPALNRFCQEQYGLKAQLLHAYRIECEKLPQTVTAPLPGMFEKILS